MKRCGCKLEDSIEMEFRKEGFECGNWVKVTCFVKQVYQDLTLDWWRRWWWWWWLGGAAAAAAAGVVLVVVLVVQDLIPGSDSDFYLLQIIHTGFGSNPASYSGSTEGYSPELTYEADNLSAAKVKNE